MLGVGAPSSAGAVVLGDARSRALNMAPQMPTTHTVPDSPPVARSRLARVVAKGFWGGGVSTAVAAAIGAWRYALGLGARGTHAPYMRPRRSGEAPRLPSEQLRVPNPRRDHRGERQHEGDHRQQTPAADHDQTASFSPVPIFRAARVVPHDSHEVSPSRHSRLDQCQTPYVGMSHTSPMRLHTQPIV